MSQLICRTCLEEIIDSNCIRLDDETNEIKQKLTVCVPELDLHVIPDACMCIYCANLLQTAYDFKQRCLRTEEKIRINKNIPDLSQIKENIEKDEKFDVVHGIGIGMEVVFIKDEDLVIEGSDVGSESQHLTNGDDFVNWFLDLNNQQKQEKVHLDNYKIKNAKNVNTKMNSSKKNVLSNKLSKKLNNSFETQSNKKPIKTNIVAKKSYNCPNCEYQTSFDSYFKKHMRYCKPSNVANGSKIVKNEKTFKCSKCDYITALKKALSAHIGRVHNKEKKLDCPKCSYTTVSSLLLKQHITNSHSGKPQFKCKVCSFSTNFLKGLNSHLRKHTKKESFSCKYCSFKAVEKIHVKKHAMKHHPKKKL